MASPVLISFVQVFPPFYIKAIFKIRCLCDGIVWFMVAFKQINPIKGCCLCVETLVNNIRFALLLFVPNAPFYSQFILHCIIKI